MAFQVLIVLEQKLSWEQQQQQQLALDLQVKCDLIRPPVVAGHTAVVARILGFHCADDEAAVAMDTAATIHQNRAGGPISAAERKKKKEKKLGLWWKILVLHT